ncbi:MAG: RNA polymerase sigma factor [Candidatus Kapaibacterium sp.]
MNNEYSKYNDNELVAAMADRSSSEGAFRELYNRYSSMVHAYCMKITGDEEITDDIFQETFIRFYRKIDPKLDNLNVKAFLIKIAKNLCINHNKLKKNNIPIDQAKNILRVSQDYEQRELLELLDLSLGMLDDEFREAFVLREYAGMSYKDIADTCDISENNAKSRVFRAKKKIKEILKPYIKDIIDN